jgi:hypothetical protein
VRAGAVSATENHQRKITATLLSLEAGAIRLARAAKKRAGITK